MSHGQLLVPSPRKRSTVDWAGLEDALRKLEAGEEIAVDVDGRANRELEILWKWPDQTGLKAAGGRLSRCSRPYKLVGKSE